METRIDIESFTARVASRARIIERCFAPLSLMLPEEWAEEVYRLPNGGRFRWSFAPYTLAMFRSLWERATVETVYQLYSRGLKSTVVLLGIGYTVDMMPRRILSLWPTDSQAEKWRKENLNGELFDTVASLNRYGTKGNRRLTSNTLKHIVYPGGVIEIFGANSPGEMRRAKGSFLYAEEIDAIKTEQNDEGDQLTIFNKRGDEYPDTIRVFASYPALKLLDQDGNPRPGHSRIDAKLRRTDYNEWFSHCIKCGGEPFVMNRRMLRYDADKPEAARLECPRCAALLTDTERYEMAHRQGFDNWRPRYEFRGRRGFHANAMLWPHPFDPVKCPGGLLQHIAQQEIDADHSDNPRRSWRVLVNTVDAEPFDPLAESEQPPDWKPIFDRRENYGLTIPEGGLFLTAFCDVQRNRIEVGWRAWGADEESWGMDHVVLDGYTSHREVWQALRAELGREWNHATGAKLHLGMAFVDGGAYTEDIYRFLQNLGQNPADHVNGHVRVSKGVGRFGAPVVTPKVSSIAKNLRGHEIGTWDAKDKIYARLRAGLAATEGRMHFNHRYTQEYFQQLTVEKVAIEFDGGQEIRKYTNESDARNEAIDIEVGCFAAVRLHLRNWELLAQQIAREAEARKSGKPWPETEFGDNEVVVVGGSW
jgi:phage terminase large subunit GpA-like protein